MGAAFYLNGRRLNDHRPDSFGAELSQLVNLFSEWDLQLLRASAWSALQWEQFVIGPVSTYHHLFMVSTPEVVNAGVIACYAFPGESWLHLQKMMIRPGLQGRGLGGQLMEQLRHHFPGIAIQLEVSTENTQAIGFYEAQGFSRGKISRGLYSDGSSALLMSG